MRLDLGSKHIHLLEQLALALSQLHVYTVSSACTRLKQDADLLLYQRLLSIISTTKSFLSRLRERGRLLKGIAGLCCRRLSQQSECAVELFVANNSKKYNRQLPLVNISSSPLGCLSQSIPRALAPLPYLALQLCLVFLMATSSSRIAPALRLKEINRSRK